MNDKEKELIKDSVKLRQSQQAAKTIFAAEISKGDININGIIEEPENVLGDIFDDLSL